MICVASSVIDVESDRKIKLRSRNDHAPDSVLARKVYSDDIKREKAVSSVNETEDQHATTSQEMFLFF